MQVTITGPGPASTPACEAILRSLPEWFGIETAVVQYAKDAAVMPTWTASVDGLIVGFVTLRRHFATSCEVHCIAVHAEHRSRGIGSALMARVEAVLKAKEVRMLQVKTLGPSRPSEHYAQTRRFYEQLGFVPIEEFPELWSKGNPCLMLVKPLGHGN